MFQPTSAVHLEVINSVNYPVLGEHQAKCSSLKSKESGTSATLELKHKEIFPV